MPVALMMAALCLYLTVGAAIIQAIDNHVRKDLEAVGLELPSLEWPAFVVLLAVWPVPVAIYSAFILLFDRKK